MYDETIIDRDGSYGFQFAVVLFYESDSYFGNIQDSSSLCKI